MNRTIYIRSVWVLALWLALGRLAGAEVVRAVIDGPIQPITEEYIARAVDLARQDHAAALVIELSTPGGLVDSTRQIISTMENSPVPVIAYVGPSGSRAASAGFFILEAADVAAMAPGTNTGAAHPVEVGGTMDPIMKDKVENDAAAFMRSFVSKRGRNIDVAESAVRQSKSFTDQEALKQRLIEHISPSLEDLFKDLDGSTVVRFDGSQSVLHLEGQPVRTLDLTLRERILTALMDPNLSFLILIAGVLLIYAEFNFPGTIVPGALGTLLLMLGLFALNLLPLNDAGVALILSSLALFVLDAKFSTHGVLAMAGVAALVFGSLLLVDAPIPEMRVHLSTALTLGIVFGGITTFLATLAFRARRNKSVTGAQGLIGLQGEVLVALNPRGKVFVHGEIWNSICDGGAHAGDRVRVISIQGLVLTVEKIADASEAASDRQQGRAQEIDSAKLMS